MELENLKELIKVLRDNNITEYQGDGFALKFHPDYMNPVEPQEYEIPVIQGEAE